MKSDSFGSDRSGSVNLPKHAISVIFCDEDRIFRDPLHLVLSF